MLLSSTEQTLLVITSALIAHLVFNRWEPTNVPILTVLLIGIPCALTQAAFIDIGPIWRVVCTFALYHASLATSVLIYRLSPWHPLARYPGPRLLKTSKIWMIRLARRGGQWRYIRALHDVYGPVVRIGPNELSFCDASLVVPILGTQGLPKGSDWMGRAMHPQTPSLIALRDPVEHQRRRRTWNRAFRPAAVQEYLPLIRKRTAQLLDILAKCEDQDGVDLAKWIRYFKYDFMGDLVFGGGTEMMRDGDVDARLQQQRAGVAMMVVFAHMPWVAQLAKNLPAVSRKVTELRAMGRNRAADRCKAGSQGKDLFYYLANEDGSEKEAPSEDVVLSDGLLAIVAGSDTTSTVLTSAIYCLLTYPETYERLVEEVDNFYPPDEDWCSTKHHADMHYLTAVLNETLRLFPILRDGSLRAPWVGHGDCTVGPHFIPEGTQVRLHTYALHRDPRYFSRPDSFWPERWLVAAGAGGDAPAGFAHEPGAFIPFSRGPSDCAGKALALQDMRIVLCALLQRLAFAPPRGAPFDEWKAEMDGRFANSAAVFTVSVRVRRRD
ncbi:cytochrome P450 [Phanerochaete sordida]|uniref:Cytochrome P450 n=1 Tax=Phanerochaete sordida TaxID=48140 RepID=A0A9P3GB39_9APHY|nr:cytochrome P450 [Phanerochaete sordida]